MTISAATSPELLNGGVGARLAVADDARMSSSHPRAGGPSRRGSFTAAEKLEHLQGYELACEQQQAGAYLRREGLYSSQVVEWRRLRCRAGVLDAKAKAKAKATTRKVGPAHRRAGRDRPATAPAGGDAAAPGHHGDRAQREPRLGAKVVRIEDGESGLSARTIKRRLASIAGLYEYLIIPGDTAVSHNPVPCGLALRAKVSAPCAASP